MHLDFIFLWYIVLGLLFSGHSVYIVLHFLQDSTFNYFVSSFCEYD